MAHLTNPEIKNEQKIVNNNILNSMSSNSYLHKPIIEQKVLPNVLHEKIAFVNVNIMMLFYLYF